MFDITTTEVLWMSIEIVPFLVHRYSCFLWFQPEVPRGETDRENHCVEITGCELLCPSRSPQVKGHGAK